jgi:predicted dehydrogenase
MDIGSHRVDLFLQLMGEVKTVKANLIDSSDYEAEQTATLLLQFAGGAHGVLQCYFGTVNAPDRLEVVGSDGRITVEDLNHGDLQLFTAAGHVQESHAPASNLHGPLVEDFSAALLAGRTPTVSGLIGKQTNDVIQMAYDDAAAEKNRNTNPC